MAHWPKTISGNLFTIALAILVIPMLVWFLIALPALFQLGLAAIALALRRSLPLASQAREGT